MSTQFQFGKMKSVLEMGCMRTHWVNMNVQFTLVTCTLKNGYDGKFYVMLCLSYHNFLFFKG